jgi:hypothetical protein
MERVKKINKTCMPFNLIESEVYLLLGLDRFFFSLLILYTGGRTPIYGDQPIAISLHIHRATQTQNERAQTSISPVGFEPTTSVFERAKAVHALDEVHCGLKKENNLGLVEGIYQDKMRNWMSNKYLMAVGSGLIGAGRS